MANQIRVRRGMEAFLPTLLEGEPGFCTDTKALYVGTSSGNVRLAKGTLAVAATLTAAGWSGGQQTISDSAILAGSNGTIRIAQGASDAQFGALCAAQPRVVSQLAGSITVKAVGTVPAVDIPVEVVIWG